MEEGEDKPGDSAISETSARCASKPLLKTQGAEDLNPNEERAEGEIRVSHFWECLYSIIVTVNGLTIGVSMCMVGVLVPMLEEEEDERLRVDLKTGSRIATLWLLSGTLVAPACGYLSDRFGRRPVLLILGQPFLAASWAMTAAAPSLEWIYAARIVSGVSDGAVYPLLTLYISEISTSKLRAPLANLVAVTFSTGSLVAYAMGWAWHWRTINWVLFGISIPLAIMTLAIPETPYYLLSVEREAEARSVLRKLRGPNQDAVDEEVSEILRVKAKKDESSRTKKGCMVLTQPDFLKLLARSSTVNVLTMLSGMTVLFMFTINVLRESGATWNPRAAAVIVAAVRVTSACCSSYVQHVCRRIPLLVASSSAIAVLYSAMAVMSFVRRNQPPVSPSAGATSTNSTTTVNDDDGDGHPDQPSSLGFLDFVPTVCVLSILAVNSLGYIPVARLLSVEIFPTESRSRAASINFVLIGLTLCGVTHLFPISLERMGFPLTCGFFALSSAATGLAAWALMPETKGRTLAAIEERLNKNKEGAKDKKEEAEANA